MLSIVKTALASVGLVLAVSGLARGQAVEGGGKAVAVDSVVGKVAAGGEAAGAPARDANAGPLGEVHEELARILKLIAPDGNATLDRESWQSKDADPAGVAAGPVARVPGRSDLGRLLTAACAKAGSRRSSMSIGGDREQGSFTGGRLEGSYVSQGDAMEVFLTEKQAPGRLLRVRCDEEGLSIQLLDGAGDQVLLLTQDANGAIRLLHVRGEEVTRLKAGNYRALAKDCREYVDKTLRPVLEGVGVALPMSPWSQPVRAAILEALQAPKPAVVAELIAKLDSEKAAEREAATKALSAAYLACHKALKAALESPDSSAEVKVRVQEIFKQNRDKEEPAGLIESLGLLQDAELLSDMLKNAKSDEDKRALSEALAKIKK